MLDVISYRYLNSEDPIDTGWGDIQMTWAL